jgi:hypothetical protein
MLNDYGKKLLKLGTPKDSLEHVDPTLKITEGIPNQYDKDTGGNAGDSFEFPLSDKEQDQINRLLDPIFQLKVGS